MLNLLKFLIDASYDLTGYLMCAIGEGNKATELLHFHQILFSGSGISGRKRN